MKIIIGSWFAVVGSAASFYYGYVVEPGKFVVSSFIALMGLVAAYDFYREHS